MMMNSLSNAQDMSGGAGTIYMDIDAGGGSLSFGSSANITHKIQHQLVALLSGTASYLATLLAIYSYS
jgi:hypothetical protein